MSAWKARENKFHNKVCEADGYSFDSQGERELYYVLKLLVLDGKILNIKCQDRVTLGSAKYVMIPDFRATLANGIFEWYEFKGFEAPRWATNKKMWAAYGPGPLHIYKKNRDRLYLEKTIIPIATKTGLCPECKRPLEKTEGNVQ